MTRFAGFKVLRLLGIPRNAEIAGGAADRCRRATMGTDIAHIAGPEKFIAVRGRSGILPIHSWEVW